MNDEINIKIESTAVTPPVNRKLNIGKIAANWLVCSKCGQLIGSLNNNCSDHGSHPSMTLKNYYETKYNKPYIDEEWKHEALPDLINE